MPDIKTKTGLYVAVAEDLKRVVVISTAKGYSTQVEFDTVLACRTWLERCLDEHSSSGEQWFSVIHPVWGEEALLHWSLLADIVTIGYAWEDLELHRAMLNQRRLAKLQQAPRPSRIH